MRIQVASVFFPGNHRSEISKITETVIVDSNQIKYDSNNGSVKNDKKNNLRWQMKFSDVQALFFDFDGVILDSTKIKTEAFKNMYEPFGQEIVDKVLDHHLSHGGISRVEKIAFYHKNFLKKELSQNELNELAERFSSQVKDLVVESDWIPGAREFLEFYNAKIPLLVVSGTPEEELLEIIKRRKMESFFKKVMGSPIRKPEHVNKCLNHFNWRAEKCFFIGDALTDFNTAKETGLHFIGIRGEMEFPKGTIVLDDCIELKKAIESQ